MKSLSARERFMITALPAALLLMVYFFFVARPADSEVKDLRRQVSVAQSRVPSPHKIAETSKQLRELESEVSVLREAARKREEGTRELLAYWNDPDAQAKGAEEVGKLLALNRVVLVEETLAEDSERERFTPLLEALPSAELWRLRLAGSYDSVRETVAALGKTSLPVVPAAIEMEPKVEGNRTVHLWNLWICR